MSSIITDQIKEMARQGCTCPPYEVLSMISVMEGELAVYTFRHRSGCPYMQTAPTLALTPPQLPATT